MIDLLGVIQRLREHIGQLVADPRRYHGIKNDVSFLALARVERHDLEIEGFIEALGIVLAVDELHQ